MNKRPHKLKAAANLMLMLPKKILMLILLQVVTCGLVFVFADVIEPILYSVLFDGLQNASVAQMISTCILCMGVLGVMLCIQYINDVILDANTYDAINTLRIAATSRYHEVPHYITSPLSQGDVFNRLSNGSSSAAGISVSIMMVVSNVVSVVVLLVMCANISLSFALLAVALSTIAVIRIQIRTKQTTAYSIKNENIVAKVERSRYCAIHDMEFAIMNDVQEHLLADYRAQREHYWRAKYMHVKKGSVLNAVTSGFDHVLRCIAPFALLTANRLGCVGYGMATSAISILDSLRESVPYLSDSFERVVGALEPIERLSNMLQHSPPAEAQEKHSSDEKKSAVWVEQLSLKLDDKQVLRDITLHIPSGQKVAIIGKNGSGKSTLLKVLLGRYLPDGGDVRVLGVHPAYADHQQKRALFSYVPASAQLFGESNRDNIAMGCDEDELAGIPKAAVVAQVEPDMMDAYGGAISGGQAQRVSIARAAVHQAPVLIMDEPTSALGSDQGREILKALLLSENTVLVATHDAAQLDLFDRIILLANGRKVYDGGYDQALEMHDFQNWIGTTNT